MSNPVTNNNSEEVPDFNDQEFLTKEQLLDKYFCNPQITNNNRRYKCKVCGHYIKATDLKRHQATHDAKGLAYTCNHCGKIFKNNGALNCHHRFCKATTVVNKKLITDEEMLQKLEKKLNEVDIIDYYENVKRVIPITNILTGVNFKIEMFDRKNFISYEED